MLEGVVVTPEERAASGMMNWVTQESSKRILAYAVGVLPIAQIMILLDAVMQACKPMRILSALVESVDTDQMSIAELRNYEKMLELEHSAARRSLLRLEKELKKKEK